MIERHGLDAALASFPAAVAGALRARARTPRTCPTISAAEAAAWSAELGTDVPGLMLRLLPWAASFAMPPISAFCVGAVAQGSSGALYAGANLEFPGQALSFSVHAEQSATTNAWLHGETGLTALAVNAAPCGYCRQFLNELATASGLIVYRPNTSPARLTALLPDAFGPQDLAVDGRLMQRSDQGFMLQESSEDPVVHAALAAANASYAPYGKTYAGVALRTASGAIYEGRYAENAAFNPSLSPLQSALAHLSLCGETYDAIAAAALVENAGPVSQRGATTVVLSAMSDVALTYALAIPG